MPLNFDETWQDDVIDFIDFHVGRWPKASLEEGSQRST
jgi:hypothetical protein